tara:strand:+ start:450 stop:1268 length:819 start_codon:yes stop_codon:yes gene_type:complete
MLFKFVAGNKIKDVLYCSRLLLNKNHIPIINYISEYQKDNNINTVFDQYNKLIDKLDSKYYIALKLSSLNFNQDYINTIAIQCNKKNIKLIIDAENDKFVQQYRNIVNDMILKYNKDNKQLVIKTYQMYRKDSFQELKDDIAFYKSKDCTISSKLVRGAYWNTDNNTGQLFTDKKDTDNSFNKAIKLCYYSRFNNHIICTHNKKSIDLAVSMDNYKNKFIIANLMGMNNTIMNNLYHNKATYIPFGPYHKMIPYLTRRLYENIDQIKYININ